MYMYVILCERKTSNQIKVVNLNKNTTFILTAHLTFTLYGNTCILNNKKIQADSDTQTNKKHKQSLTMKVLTINKADYLYTHPD